MKNRTGGDIRRNTNTGSLHLVREPVRSAVEECMPTAQKAVLIEAVELEISGWLGHITASHNDLYITLRSLRSTCKLLLAGESIADPDLLFLLINKVLRDAEEVRRLPAPDSRPHDL
jgi:hypothetical protein